MNALKPIEKFENPKKTNKTKKLIKRPWEPRKGRPHVAKRYHVQNVIVLLLGAFGRGPKFAGPSAHRRVRCVLTFYDISFNYLKEVFIPPFILRRGGLGIKMSILE